jgi:AraC-like DNA-binding protein
MLAWTVPNMAYSTQMDHHAVPEHALTAFERLHGLTVTVQDLRGDLGPFLLADRQRHRHPLCNAVKNGGFERTCIAFDVHRLRQDLAFHPEGRIQICHAGIMELVVPVFSSDGLDWILFAGAMTPGAIADSTVRSRESAAAQIGRRPTPTDAEHATLLLEALRQVGARLARWAQHARRTSPHRHEGPLMLRRRVAIMQFIETHHMRDLAIADLGRHLGLSPNRASAAVRSACDATFVELLQRARLTTAADLLRHTDLPVSDVGRRCGFGDASHFFRCFRKRYGATPRAWRKNSSATPVEA